MVVLVWLLLSLFVVALVGGAVVNCVQCRLCLCLLLVLVVVVN